MNRKWFLAVFFPVLMLIVFQGCDLIDDEGEIPKTEDQYLISYSVVASYPLDLAVKPLFQKIEAEFPDASGITQKAKHGVWVYRINYRTQYKDQEVVASGLVCIPMSTGPFPLLSFQNGTNTLHINAPTKSPTDSLFVMIEAIAATGFIVTLPDYLGFGASSTMFHPYMHKASTVKSVVDMFRAVKELMVHLKNISLSKDTYLMGYSQGGWSTLALKYELENNLSQEFTLKAASCGASPYDLTHVSNVIFSRPVYDMPYFLAYIMNSWILSSEINLTYTDIFSAPYSGQGYIQELFNGTHDSGYINGKLNKTLNQLFKNNFLDSLATAPRYKTIRDALSNNSIKAWKTTSPLLLVHGMNDTYVTPTVMTKIQQDFVSAGVAPGVIEALPVPGLGHHEAVVPWGVKSLHWILKKAGI